MEFELATIIPYGLVGLGAVAVGIKKFTNIFPTKNCPMTSCPDAECQGDVKALKEDISAMKPQLLTVQTDTAHIKGQVDILVKKMVHNSG